MGSNSELSAIGKRIAELRQKNNLTQAELAQRVSVSRENINYWENGNRDIKTYNIVLLAEALNTTCDYLLRGVELKNHDIYKETGLSNAAINNLREIAKFAKDGNPMFPALDALLTSDYFEGLLLYFYFVQHGVDMLKTSIWTLTKSMNDNQDDLPTDFIKYANAIKGEEHPYFVEAAAITGYCEEIDYNLYKMQNILRDIIDDYKEQALREVINVAKKS